MSTAKIGIINVSDRASQGIYEDIPGKEVVRLLDLYLTSEWEQDYAVIPDEVDQLQAAMKKMAGTLKLDLALYREMAAFSSFGFDESTQELLRRGAALTEMLKQQQFRPLAGEIQVIVLFNGIRERITPKQIRFYEYQVVPNLLFGLHNNTLRP